MWVSVIIVQKNWYPCWSGSVCDHDLPKSHHTLTKWSNHLLTTATHKGLVCWQGVLKSGRQKQKMQMMKRIKIQAYRNIGSTVLPLPQPTSKTFESSLQDANSGNSFNKYRLSCIQSLFNISINPRKLKKLKHMEWPSLKSYTKMGLRWWKRRGKF